MTESTEQQPKSEYEIKRDAEQAAAKKAYEDLYAGVAEHLGEGWTVMHPDREDDNGYGHERMNLTLTAEPRKRISLSIITYGSDRGKVNVSGYWPQKGEHGAITSPREVNETTPSIKCSLAKGPALIAKDITRRFLPEYHRVWAKCEERIQQHIAYDSKQTYNWARVCEVPCVKCHGNDRKAGDIRLGTPDQEGHFNYSNGYGSIFMSSADSVQIELRSVPIERALAILRAIGETEPTK